MYSAKTKNNTKTLLHQTTFFCIFMWKSLKSVQNVFAMCFWLLCC